MLIDTHCHVHDDAFDRDRLEVIDRALLAQVQMITVGTNKRSSQQAVDLASQHEGMWAVVGMDSEHLSSEVFDLNEYKAIASHVKCVGIGETGFDFYRISPTADPDQVIQAQRVNIEQHAILATELNLPLVVHCRDAYDEQADLLEALIGQGQLPKRGVIHCFTGTFDQAQRFISLGFYISFSGIVTFPPRKNETLVQGMTMLAYCAKTLPLEWIVIETDAPYLSPVPHRGVRNEPVFVKQTAQFIAEVRSCSVEQVINQTTQN